MSRTRCNFGVADDWYAPARPVDAVDCRECGGKGAVLVAHGASPEAFMAECPECEGRGWIVPEDEPVN